MLKVECCCEFSLPACCWRLRPNPQLTPAQGALTDVAAVFNPPFSASKYVEDTKSRRIACCCRWLLPQVTAAQGSPLAFTGNPSCCKKQVMKKSGPGRTSPRGRRFPSTVHNHIWNLNLPNCAPTCPQVTAAQGALTNVAIGLRRGFLDYTSELYLKVG